MNQKDGNFLKNAENDKRDIVRETVGDFGKWQFKISFLMSLLKCPIAWFQLGIVFIAFPADFTCKIPTENENIGWHLEAKPNECFLRNVSFLNESAPQVPCLWGYNFDKSVMGSSIIMEWDLVCEKSWFVELTQISFMFGVLIGNVIFGLCADKYGRKISLIISIIIQAVCGIISSLVPSFWAFVFFRFLLALGNGGIIVSSFVLCMESVGGKYRTIVPILYQIPFLAGQFLMTLFAYFLKDWRNLHLILSFICCLFILYAWLITESPRWLLAVGKKKQALKVLKSAAKINKIQLSTFDKIELTYDSKKILEKPKFSELLVTPGLRKRTLFLSLNWFITGAIFYAFSQYMSSVGRNVFLSVLVSGVLSLPGTLFCIYIIKKCGRKKTIIFSKISATIAIAAIAIFPKGHYPGDWPRLLLSALAFTGMAVSLPATFLYTSELYPTTLRNAGSGGTIMFSKIGSIIAPLILTLQNTHEALPVLVLGALGLFTIAFIAPLPETMGKELLENVADLEKQRKKKKPIIIDSHEMEDFINQNELK